MNWTRVNDFLYRAEANGWTIDKVAAIKNGKNKWCYVAVKPGEKTVTGSLNLVTKVVNATKQLSLWS